MLIFNKINRILIILVILSTWFILLTKATLSYPKTNRPFFSHLPQEFYEQLRRDIIDVNVNDTSFYNAFMKNEINWDNDNVQHMFNFHPSFPSNDIPQSRSPLSPRIINGRQANRNQFLYQAAVYMFSFRGTFFCGGAILSTNYIITAAHCVQGAIFFQVIVGTHNIIKPEKGSQKILAFESVTHPGWNPIEVVNDIALIKLFKPIIFNEYVQPVKLTTKSEENNTFVGKLGIVSGWGITHDWEVHISEFLRYTENPILSNSECSKQMENLYIPSTQICMSGANYRGTCSGDSGGPLVINSNELIGTVSYGLKYGCELGYPSAFTRISCYLDWISMHTGVKIKK